MLAQLANPGSPVFYGCISSLADMNDMKYLSGAVEMGLMNAAASQLAHYYRLPIYATAGMSDSKTVDAQAGIESAVTTVLVSLAGGNFIHDAAGFLEFCMCASLEKYVLDDEILGMAMRAVEGIKVNPDTLAFEVLKEVGPGGHFVSSRHTRKYMRKEQFHPTICDRSQRAKWIETGRKDIRERARTKVKKILSKPVLPVLNEGILQRLKEEIPGIETDVFQGQLNDYYWRKNKREYPVST
jgi:trimethylamine--corrinoid protein Co-methyltransferase